MSAPSDLVGHGIDFERLDTREVSRGIVWAIRDDGVEIQGAAFLRRSYGLEEPASRASVFVVADDGAIYRAEVGYDTLTGFGVWAAASRDGFDMPDVTRGYPDSMPRLFPL